MAELKSDTQRAQDARPRGVLPIDWLFLGYLVIDTVVLLAHARDVALWPLLVLANVVGAALVAALARAPRTRFVDLIGGAYPILLAPAFYTQLGIVTIDVGVLHDPWVQRLEQALFGGQPSLTWHARMPNPVLSWILHLCYGGYYAFLVGPPLFLFFRRKLPAFERGAFIMTLGMYTCYVIFALFPVGGPRYVWGNATGSAAAVLPARIMRLLSDNGAALGTAFPSSHVVESWCAVYALWRDARPVALLLAPLALGLALGTVYGQFHYAVDALAGAALAVLLWVLADYLRGRLAASSRPSP